MNTAKKSVLVLALAGSMLGGGAVGATLFSAGTGGAQSTSTTDASSAATDPPSANNAPSGKFTPNEDATHEGNESAAREAMEDAGQRPNIP